MSKVSGSLGRGRVLFRLACSAKPSKLQEMWRIKCAYPNPRFDSAVRLEIELSEGRTLERCEDAVGSAPWLEETPESMFGRIMGPTARQVGRKCAYARRVAVNESLI